MQLRVGSVRAEPRISETGDVMGWQLSIQTVGGLGDAQLRSGIVFDGAGQKEH